MCSKWPICPLFYHTRAISTRAFDEEGEVEPAIGGKQTVTVEFGLLLRGRTEDPPHIGHTAGQLALDTRRPPDAQSNGADLEGYGATVAVGSQTAQEVSQGQLAVAGYLVVLEVSVEIPPAQRPGGRTHVAEVNVH